MCSYHDLLIISILNYWYDYIQLRMIYIFLYTTQGCGCCVSGPRGFHVSLAANPQIGVTIVISNIRQNQRKQARFWKSFPKSKTLCLYKGKRREASFILISFWFCLLQLWICIILMFKEKVSQRGDLDERMEEISWYELIFICWQICKEYAYIVWF